MGKVTVVVVDLTTVHERLDRIERAIRTSGRAVMDDIHGEIAAAVQPVLDKLAATRADLAQLVTDFANKINPHLNDADRSTFAALLNGLTEFDNSVNTADQDANPLPDEPPVDEPIPPVDAEPAPVETVGGGSTDEPAAPAV